MADIEADYHVDLEMPLMPRRAFKAGLNRKTVNRIIQQIMCKVNPGKIWRSQTKRRGNGYNLGVTTCRGKVKISLRTGYVTPQVRNLVCL
jgi:hypothetical protein